MNSINRVIIAACATLLLVNCPPKLLTICAVVGLIVLSVYFCSELLKGNKKP